MLINSLKHLCNRMPFKPQENLTMKKTLSSLAVAALALFGAQAVMAQAASSPSRAEVKKETAAANKAGGIAAGDAGQTAVGEKQLKDSKSNQPRAEVKKETAAANKSGAIADTSGGAGVTAAGEKQVKDSKSTQPRAEVKKETAEANKAGAIPGTGMSNVPDQATGQQPPKKQ